MRRNNTERNPLLLLAAVLFALSFLSAKTTYAAPVDSLIAGHNTCVQCHGRFPGTGGFKQDGDGRPAVIPKNKIDILCMSCHGPAGIANTKANVHGRLNYVMEPIGCVTCHDPHDNTPNYMQGTNIKSIGRKLPQQAVAGDVEAGNRTFAKIDTPNSGVRYVVFESRGSDAGDPPMHSFADGDRDKNGVYDGICEVCHTRTKYHRNIASGNHSHYAGQTCTNCHLHVNQFLAFGDSPGNGLELSGTVIDNSGFPWVGITLFVDVNGNGLYDEGEPTAVTDKDGNFIFEGFVNKGFNVLVHPDSIPEGYDVAVTSDGNVVVIKTTAQPAGVEGYVWSDANLSGMYDDGDEGIPAATVFIDANNNKVHDVDEPSAVTDATGLYTIAGLPHGPYHIQVDEESLPVDYQHITNNNPAEITLEPGQQLTDINFGYRSRFAFDPDNTRLLYPTRLAWSSNGGYLVTDSKVDAMFIHDETGKLTGKISRLDKPMGVVTDAQGNIYIGNNGSNNVVVYSPAGMLKRVVGAGELMMPNDLAIDKKQNLYVLDSQIKQVKVYNPKGELLRKIGDAGAGDGRFTFPVAIAINYRMVNEAEVGELYVADKNSSRIQVFDLAGSFLRSFGGPVEEQSGGGMMGMFGGMFGGGTTTWVWEGKFAGIQSLAFDQHGRLHALDSYMDNVQILDPVTGAYLDSYDAFLEDTGAHLQLDIDISPEGRVIMTDAATRRVEFIYTVQ